MNDLIGWLATNNTLMIRIGFSAVAVLVVAYVFRLFFMPRDVEKAVVANDMMASSATGSMNIEELAELQTEIDTLKEKVKVIETEKLDLQKRLYEQPVTMETAAISSPDGVTQVVPKIDPATASQSTESAIKMNLEHGELIQKIQQLEARLAEYEIIAEDIADVGQLKSENAQLKVKLEEAVLKAAEPRIEAVPEITETASLADEVVAVVTEADTSASDAEIDAMLQESLGESGVSDVVAESRPQTQVVLHSEIEVTEEEKLIIDEFESFQNRKKG
jgi:regulator of replication initiation timing